MRQVDTSFCRPDFPALRREAGGRPAIFLDGPGGTQVPVTVAEAMAGYLVRCNANIHGAFPTSRETDEVIDRARRAMAVLLSASPSEIAFGANMTTLNFALARAIGRGIAPGDEVVITDLDHEANRAPWETLAEKGAVVKSVRVRPGEWTLDMDDLAAKVTPRTKVVALGYASNAVGTVNDVAAAARLAHAAGALCVVDAVHFAPHGVIDVAAIGCDFLLCSAYKFFGPHVGVLYGRTAAFAALDAYKVKPQDSRHPYKIETGTQNHEGLAGVTAAVEFIARLGRRARAMAEGNMAIASSSLPFVAAATDAALGQGPSRGDVVAGLTAIEGHERPLARRLQEGLSAIPGVTVYGPPATASRRAPTVSFTVSGRKARSVTEGLAAKGIFAWDGDFYATTLLAKLGLAGLGGLVRFGLAPYNTAEEIEYTLEHVARSTS
jgi:cysteine desulfurase family protein (TIGR01976 family)